MNLRPRWDETQSSSVQKSLRSYLDRRYAPSVVRVDAPLPGDLVIRCRRDESLVRRGDVFVITHWPDADITVAGPYQSYGYALRQAHGMLKDRSERIWYDHAPPGRPEQLEQVGGHGHS
jgi:hypothetical protein